MIAWLEGLRSALAHAWVARAVGWTLVHFCWQGVVVAALLWSGLELTQGRGARLRYGVACAALGLMVALPVATLARVGAAEYRAATGGTRADEPGLTVRVGIDDTSSGWLARTAAKVAREIDPAMPWVMLAWLAGAGVFGLRLGVGFEVTRRMRRVGVWAVPAELQARFAALVRQMGVRRAVGLMHSAPVQAPTVIGWLRPLVLLPAQCMTGLTEEQLEAVLCHELAHVLRQDYVVSAVQAVVEALLFYHPAVWFVSRQVRRERECCCDEIAVAVGGDRLAYARALALLESRRGSYPQVLLGANGGELTMRIKRMLRANEGSGAGQAAAVVVLAMLAVGAAAIGSTARAQAGTVATGVPLQTEGAARVSGGVMAEQIVSKVNPVYPADAKAAGVQGAVVLRAIISKTGEVENLQAVSGPPELMSSALDAVRQWKYQPYLLNGQPTKVETTITVNYQLAR